MPFDSGSMRNVPARRRRRRRAVDEVFEVEPYAYATTRDRNADLEIVVASFSVAEVIELIETGEAELDEVIAAERVGKNRKTILALVQSESGKVYPVSKTGNDNPFAG